MSESILVACITGSISLLGTIITVLAAHRKTVSNIQLTQAIMKRDIEELTREVREHNNFARRMPVVEEQIKVINHRIDDLEKGKT